MINAPVNPGWFVVALQALVFLGREHITDGMCSSATLAQYVRAHPVFLRRVFSPLVHANIVEAREGRDGGYRLARPADQITLAEVYRVIKASGTGESNPPDSPRGPTLQPGMRAALNEIVEETEEHILEVLGRHTVGELAARAAALGNGHEHGHCHSPH